MTKLRKSKFDCVSPSRVLRADEHFSLLDIRCGTDDLKDRADYKAAMKIIQADKRSGVFKKRDSFYTFAEAREHANELNKRYGTKFGVTTGIWVQLPF